VRIQQAVTDQHSLVLATVSHAAADQILDDLTALGVPRRDVTLTRVEELGGAPATDASLIWADVVGLAGTNARLIARYLVFMAAAGVIACYGVVDANPILIVGAMAVSPDNINETVLRSLATVNDETIAVALAAGVAGMLAFETRASSGVGVAISVTTIPAAAYLGVAVGLGEATKALGALGVLATNVLMIVAGASITLGLQRTMAGKPE
jgi:hypothetical protein